MKEARSVKPLQSLTLVSRRVVKAEHRHSNQSDEDREPRISIKEDSGEVSSMHESESSSKAESESDSESQIYSEISGSVEKTEVTGRGVFGSFASWLQTADGGRKPEKISKQHASQVHKMLSVIDPNKDLVSLFNKNLIRDKFLKEHAENTYNLTQLNRTC